MLSSRRPFFLASVAAPFFSTVLLLFSMAACSDGLQGEGEFSRPEVDSSETRSHTLQGLIAQMDTLTTLSIAVARAGWTKRLQREGPLTLFAPTDRAFRSVPDFDSLLATGPGNDSLALRRDSLYSWLSLHLVRGRLGLEDVQDSLTVSTLLEQPITLRRQDSSLRVAVRGMPRPARVIRSAEAQNGTLHLLSSALRIPPPDTAAEGGALNLSDTTGNTSGTSDNQQP